MYCGVKWKKIEQNSLQELEQILAYEWKWFKNQFTTLFKGILNIDGIKMEKNPITIEECEQ